jgi:uncharacterized repeat protein (TIGR01451 family)
VTITVEMTPNAPGTLQYRPSPTSNDRDPDVTNNQPWVDIPVGQVDVAIGLSGPTAPIAGTAAIYSVSASNSGPSTARDVTVTFDLPANASYVSAVGATCTAGATLTCNLGTVAAGETKQLGVTLVFADMSAGLLIATLSTPDTDTAAANNAAQLTISPVIMSDVSIVGSSMPTEGGAIVSVAVANGGPSTVDALVSVTLPAGVTATGATLVGGSCNVSAQIVTCTAQDLGGGQTAELSVALTAPPGSTHTVTVTVSAAGDVDSSDNIIAIDVTIGTGSGSSATEGSGGDLGNLRLNGVRTQGGFYRCSASNGGVDVFAVLAALLVLRRLRRRR